MEAAIDCLQEMDRDPVDGLYFASTSLPYASGKECASILAPAIDLRREIFTADFSSSLRAGSSALRAAMNAVRSGAARYVLVVSSDCRVPAPASEHEFLFGDGAAAFLVGDGDVAAKVEGSYGIASDFLDLWKLQTDSYYWTWEERFVQSVYARIVKETISSLLAKYHYSARDFARVVLYAPDPRTHAMIVRELGFDPLTQAQGSLFYSVGNTGCALAPMMLVEALEGAKAGDAILLEQVLSAPIIAWPLGLYDCCGVTDGAAAAVLCRTEDARSFRQDYVTIKGIGVSLGPGTGRIRTDYDFTHWEETEYAARHVYQQARIDNPREELDLVECHDCFSIAELIAVESLGICPRGGSKADIDSGAWTQEGEIPVNLSGGLKSFGHPIGASGCREIYQIYKQLQGKAEYESRQLKDPGMGLAHNQGGSPGRFQCAVAIVGLP